MSIEVHDDLILEDPYIWDWRRAR